jgi:flagellar motor switch protein FliG
MTRAETAPRSATTFSPDFDPPSATVTAPLRKAAILLVSLDEPLAAQLLAQLDRPAVDAVTLEMARLERIAPDEQRAVLEEFYDQGLRRHRFVFDDLARMSAADISMAYTGADATLWALALAGAAPPIRTKVLAALDSAAGLDTALARLGPFRLDDAEAAQAELTRRLRRLHDHGHLVLPGPDGQEEILV